MDELLDAAVGEAAEEAGALAVAGHALEGAHLVLAVEEEVDAVAVYPHEHLPDLPLPAGLPRLAGRGGDAGEPAHLVDLVGHGALERHDLERAAVGHVRPRRRQLVQQPPRLLGDPRPRGARRHLRRRRRHRPRDLALVLDRHHPG